MKLSEKVKSYGPWSPSKVTMALECPFRFNRVQEKAEVTTFPDDSAARVGSAIHFFIEQILEDPRKLTSPGLYYSIFSKYDLTAKEQVSFRLLKKPAEESIKRILKFKEKQGCNDDAFNLEMSLSFDDTFKTIGFFDKSVLLRGKVDLAMYLPNNTIVVVDHKTGAAVDIKEDYKFQLCCYLVMYREYLLQNSVIKESPNALYFLNVLGGDNPTIMKGELITAENFDKTITQYVTAKMESAALAAQTDQAQPGSHCRFCGHLDICPKKVKL